MGNSLRKDPKISGKQQHLPPKHVIMVGLDHSGKTSILQRVASTDITTHEPVQELKVETIKYKNMTINAWDIGISDEKIRSEWDGLLRLVYHNIDGIIFVIDSADKTRIDNSDGFLWHTARRHFDMLLEEDYAKDAAILILANKQDALNAMTINTITNKLELQTLRNRQWFITSCNAIDAENTNDGIHKGLDWLLHTLNHNRLLHTSELKSILLLSGYIRETVTQYPLWSTIPVEIIKFIHLLFKNPDYDYHEYRYYGEYDDGTVSTVCSTTILLMQFLNRKDCAGYIEDDEAFIESLDGALILGQDTQWNHYNFMRMIWIFFKLYDRRKGLNEIWKYTPYNVTKTYFWSQLIYFGMNRDNANDNDFAKRDFQYFLIINPSFSNDYAVLMKKYYSPGLIRKMEENESEMILPDLMRLPSLITNIKRVKLKIKLGEYKRFKESDESFLNHFEHKSFKCWEGHTSFIRVIWCYVNTLEAQHTSIIQRKWKAFDEYNYNMTKTYFWIHMMRYYIKLYQQEYNAIVNVDEQKREKETMEYSFERFLDFCSTKYQCQIENSEWYNEFYSHKCICNTPADKLVFPDLKPLPSL
eukprot:632194_1